MNNAPESQLAPTKAKRNATKKAKSAKKAHSAKTAKVAKKASAASERGNKKAEIIAMMKRAKGSTLGEIVEATG